MIAFSFAWLLILVFVLILCLLSAVNQITFVHWWAALIIFVRVRLPPRTPYHS